ncbi:DNA-binding protein [Bacillus thuringiensis serovar brasilensis]|uniref:WxL domain-containing protein n=1 Tax=Bacillus cereus group TaxID=86661 RepID=UPI000A3C45A0|nr:WxL domain-containing protein [Bacillus thuringiensis]MCU5032083.1 WxL domain-containing protein [Bacillus cereus]MRA75238.1 DNA-binding protein [Bacillus thuringiensis]MRA93776.1 DNA-binding protein [Bacillus thuringiensis]MRC56449.1 DNA-binding protein [Bacillus thuringiensis]OTX33621.1 DNA-binding protein [Bacillus thuringiensis serovar brasilensis]
MKRGKIFTSIMLLTAACLFIGTKDNTILAEESMKKQSDIPTLTANGKENEVKLEWAIDILEQDVLWKIDFNNPKDVNLMSGWGEFYGNGNQSLQSEVFYPNGTDTSGYKVFDTKSGGNRVLYPYKVRESSIAVFKRLNVPNNAYISATFKAKSQGLGRISFYGDGSWETGREFDYYNATVLKDVPGGSKEIEISNISLFPEREPGTNIPRDRRHITSDINKDVYQDSPMIEKVIPYQDGSGKGKIILNSPIVTPMKQGDRLKTRKWAAPIQLPNNRTVTKNDSNKDINGWSTFSMNTQVANNPFYITEQRGVTFYMLAYSEGITYVDELKVGYASEAEVYRGNQQIYKGRLSDYVDKEVKDQAVPTTPESFQIENRELKETKVTFAPAKDDGSIYHYKIRGVGRNGVSDFSKEVPATVTSGVKGYEYVVDDKADTSLDQVGGVQFTNQTSIQFPTDYEKPQYIHIRTVDKAGNKSATKHISNTQKGRVDMLTVPKSVEFTPIQLNGEKQNSFGTLGKLMIHDSRNQAGGWRLNMTISPFKESNIAKQLPKGSLFIKNQVSVTKVKGPETGKPIVQIPNTPIDNEAAHTIIRASKDVAIGEYQLDFGQNGLQLQLDPGTTYVGKNRQATYTSMVTWSLVSGP